MEYGEVAVVGLIVIGLLATGGFVTAKLRRSSRSVSARVDYALPERPPSDYCLEWSEPSGEEEAVGRGICVVRTADQQRFHWEALPDGLLSVPVSGTHFRKVALQSSAFAPGQTLSLIPEPYNPHDPGAIGVWDREGRSQIGYIPREHAPVVERMIRSGTLAGCVSMWEQLDGSARVALRVLIIRSGLDIR